MIESLIPTHRTHLPKTCQHPDPIYTHSDTKYSPIPTYRSFRMAIPTGQIVHSRDNPTQTRSLPSILLLLLLSTVPRLFSASPQTDPSPLIASKCLKTAILVSRNRSTQFCAQASSVLSSLPLEIREVMHFFQHISVKPWIAVEMSETSMSGAGAEGGGWRVRAKDRVGMR